MACEETQDIWTEQDFSTLTWVSERKRGWFLTPWFFGWFLEKRYI